MTKAAELYEHAALCHERAGTSSKEAEKRGWFELACIWLTLADTVSARIEFGPVQEPLELTGEEIIRPAVARADLIVAYRAGHQMITDQAM